MLAFFKVNENSRHSFSYFELIHFFFFCSLFVKLKMTIANESHSNPILILVNIKTEKKNNNHQILCVWTRVLIVLAKGYSY